MNQVEIIALKDNTNRNDPNNQNIQNNDPNIQITNMPLETKGMLMNFHSNTTNFKLPFDVSRELAIYTKIFVSREVDLFRIFHYTESFVEDYKIYGELPCGDKQILFTVRQHITPNCTSCSNCCKQCICKCCCEEKKGCCERCCEGPTCSFCCFGEYVCYDLVQFRLDYKRNNNLFYNQAFIYEKGCHCCCTECYVCGRCAGKECSCCCGKCCGVDMCCDPCTPNILKLRENINEFNILEGAKKGETVGTPCCCKLCRDKTVTYNTEEGSKGISLRLDCCEFCKYCCCKKCKEDLEITIEDSTGQKVGYIFIPNSCCSKTVPSCCYHVLNYFEINVPLNMPSNDKFQIIADLIHLNIENGII